jgi:hypothetical protein
MSTRYQSYREEAIDELRVMNSDDKFRVKRSEFRIRSLELRVNN